MDESTEENKVLLARIINWASNGFEDETHAPAPKRRKISDQSAETVIWTLKFVHGYNTWSGFVSPSQSLGCLFDIAFRKLNTTNPTNKADIRLYYNTTTPIASDDDNTIRSRLQPSSLITVELPAITPSPGLWTSSDFRSGCLIKIYTESALVPVFSFWESLETPSRVFSVLFHYYRKTVLDWLGDFEDPLLFSHLNFYTLAPGFGDCLLKMGKVSLWQPLRDVIYQFATAGWLGDDPFIVPPSNLKGKISEDVC